MPKQAAEKGYVGEIANTADALTKLVKQLSKGAGQLSFCYEAGACGDGIHRQLVELGWDCQVVAPSLIPRSAGLPILTVVQDVHVKRDNLVIIVSGSTLSH
ncbi:MAG: hypothetical protein NVSMB6_07440 [Burkholderiaceae bacterium]